MGGGAPTLPFSCAPAPVVLLSRLLLIMGDAEPIESRSLVLRRRTRRRMKKASIHVAAIARKPSMTMTAIAQRGKEEEEPGCWTSPDWTPPDAEGSAAEREAERDESEAARREEAEAEAREAEEEAAATESSIVVCTAVNMG
jgi:hypothetical protein